MSHLTWRTAALGTLAILALCVMPDAARGQSVAFGAYSPGANNDPARLDALARKAGRNLAIVHWYREWNDRLVYPAELDNVDQHRAAPLITWEPHDRPLKKIAGGRYDSYLRSSARDAAAWGKPILLRLAHEMNGDWYSWGTEGNSARDYKRAWRHVVSVFRAERAKNVRFVWSPNVDAGGELPFRQLFPGNRWVHWVALDGYNFGAQHGNWQSFAEIFRRSYRTLKSITRKPMMIAETSSNEAGGSKAKWTRRALECQLPSQFPKVRALVWFDRAYDGVDWRIDSSAGSMKALRDAVSSRTYSLSAEALLDGRRSAPTAGCDGGRKLKVGGATLLSGMRWMRFRVRCTEGPCSGRLEVRWHRQLIGSSRVRTAAAPSTTVRTRVRRASRRLIRRRIARRDRVRVRVVTKGPRVERARASITLRAG